LLAFVALIIGFVYRFYEQVKPPIPLSRQLEIHALDVGQGDSFLIVTPEGKTVLIDAGPPEAADTVIEALSREGVKEIDLVVATHPHADHIGGMTKMLDAFPAKMFLDSGQPHSTRTYTRMLENIRKKGIRLVAAEAGQEFELDSGLSLHVLAPTKPFIQESQGSVLNANSVVLRLTYGDFSMLFTGDSEIETEEQLLSLYPALSAKVLKVAHHGSRYSTGSAFLKSVHPEVAVISCGADNEYGHPAQTTLNRLKKTGAELYRTDLQGEITIYTDGRSYHVETEHPMAGDLWAGRSPRREEKMEQRASDGQRRPGRTAGDSEK
jgi:beta-lactamase superfamily II metal-dependent hydrolase